MANRQFIDIFLFVSLIFLFISSLCLFKWNRNRNESDVRKKKLKKISRQTHTCGNNGNIMWCLWLATRLEVKRKKEPKRQRCRSSITLTINLNAEWLNAGIENNFFYILFFRNWKWKLKNNFFLANINFYFHSIINNLFSYCLAAYFSFSFVSFECLTQFLMWRKIKLKLWLLCLNIRTLAIECDEGEVVIIACEISR